MVLDSDHIIMERTASKRGEIRALELSNARDLSRQYETFEQPSPQQMAKIKPGSFVKVARNRERFWLKVTGFEGRRFHGQVDNVLGMNPDLELGDRIYFEKKHIYDIWEGR